MPVLGPFRSYRFTCGYCGVALPMSPLRHSPLARPVPPPPHAWEANVTYRSGLPRLRDCEAEARPADEAAEAEQGQRSAFCKPAATGAAKTGHRNCGPQGRRGPVTKRTIGTKAQKKAFRSYRSLSQNRSKRSKRSGRLLPKRTGLRQKAGLTFPPACCILNIERVLPDKR